VNIDRNNLDSIPYKIEFCYKIKYTAAEQFLTPATEIENNNNNEQCVHVISRASYSTVGNPITGLVE